MVSIGMGNGFYRKNIKLEKGMYIVTLASRYTGDFVQYGVLYGDFSLVKLLSQSDFSDQENRGHISFDSETGELDIFRGIGDDWSYSVIQICPYIHNSILDL